MHIHRAKTHTRDMRKMCDKEHTFSRTGTFTRVCMLFLCMCICQSTCHRQYFCFSCSTSLSSSPFPFSSPSTLLPLSSLFFFVVHPSQGATKSFDKSFFFNSHDRPVTATTEGGGVSHPVQRGLGPHASASF